MMHPALVLRRIPPARIAARADATLHAEHDGLVFHLHRVERATGAAVEQRRLRDAAREDAACLPGPSGSTWFSDSPQG